MGTPLGVFRHGLVLCLVLALYSLVQYQQRPLVRVCPAPPPVRSAGPSAGGAHVGERRIGVRRLAAATGLRPRHRCWPRPRGGSRAAQLPWRPCIARGVGPLASSRHRSCFVLLCTGLYAALYKRLVLFKGPGTRVYKGFHSRKALYCFVLMHYRVALNTSVFHCSASF